jgi:hypothetical protein
MSSIHPVFESVAELNYEFASACSEMFVPEDYTFVQPNDVYVEDDVAGFPPEPSEILTVVASYVEMNPDDTVKGMRTQYVCLDDDKTSSEVIGEIYESYIGFLQDGFENMQRGLLKAIPVLSQDSNAANRYCMETTRKENKRLITAHLIGRTASKGELIQAITYPKSLDENIGFEVRNFAVTIMPALQVIREELQDDLDKEEFEKTEEIFKSILRMDGRMRVIGTMAAASVLPKAKLFKAGLSGHDYSEN